MSLHFDHETCSGCKACQLVCSLANFKESGCAKSFLNVYGRFPVPGKYYVDYCDECGVCADACPAGAIEDQNGVYIIDKDSCIGCEACVDACPHHVIRMVGGLAYKCNGCGECAQICPRDALRQTAKEANV